MRPIDQLPPRIVQLTPEQEAQMEADLRAGKMTNLVPVAPEDVAAVQAMNRHQRRLYVAQKRQLWRHAARRRSG